MSRYITVFDDNEPVVYLKGEPWANLAQIKQSLPLQEICDIQVCFMAQNVVCLGECYM